MRPRDDRILVTGAGGFVGQWLLRALKARFPQAHIIGVGLQRDLTSRDNLQVLDLTDRDQVSALVQRVQPTSVIHLAAIASVAEARLNLRRTWDVNLYGTMNLACAVLDHVPETRFIFSSTSEVYGRASSADSGPVNETAMLDPANPYAASKAAADLMLGQMAYEGLRAVRFRPFNHTGPGQSEQFVVPAFAFQIARIERGLQSPLIEVGNLEASRDFLDVRDVVQAYVAAIERNDLSPGIVLNLASGVARNIGSILEHLLSLSSVNVTIKLDPSRVRPMQAPISVGDARKARMLLGWNPKCRWDDTLREVLDYARARVG